MWQGGCLCSDTHGNVREGSLLLQGKDFIFFWWLVFWFCAQYSCSSHANYWGFLTLPWRAAQVGVNKSAHTHSDMTSNTTSVCYWDFLMCYFVRSLLQTDCALCSRCRYLVNMCVSFLSGGVNLPRLIQACWVEDTPPTYTICHRNCHVKRCDIRGKK